MIRGIILPSILLKIIGGYPLPGDAPGMDWGCKTETGKASIEED